MSRKTKLWIGASLALIVTVAIVVYYKSMVTPIQLPQNTVVKEKGIIVLAHGGNPRWDNEVRRASMQLAEMYPTRVVFGMAQAEKIQEAVTALEVLEVKRIVVIPLFISSHSELFRQIEYVLGLRAHPDRDFVEGMERAMKNPLGFIWGKVSWDNIPYALEMIRSHHGSKHSEERISTDTPMVLLPALNNSSLIGDILEERTLELSTNPSKETVIIVAHGPIRDDDDALWLADMERYCW